MRNSVGLPWCAELQRAGLTALHGAEARHGLCDVVNSLRLHVVVQLLKYIDEECGSRSPSWPCCAASMVRQLRSRMRHVCQRNNEHKPPSDYIYCALVCLLSAPCKLAARHACVVPRHPGSCFSTFQGTTGKFARRNRSGMLRVNSCMLSCHKGCWLGDNLGSRAGSQFVHNMSSARLLVSCMLTA